MDRAASPPPGDEEPWSPQGDPGKDGAPYPFKNQTEVLKGWNKLRMYMPGLVLIPLRLTLVLLLLLLAALIGAICTFGVSKKQLRERPLRGWRRQGVALLPWIARAILFVVGYYWIPVKGKPASREAAPIVVSNHAALTDAFLLMWTTGCCFVSRIENSYIPLVGKSLYAMQTVFVARGDSQSRDATLDALKQRSEEKGWPRVAIFPEGTTVNNTCLLGFRTGAFSPGVPVQPVVLRYKFQNIDPSWSGHRVGMGDLFFRLSAQWVNFAEIEFLPVYVPNDDEKKDPQLFADRVRDRMSDLGRMPKSVYNVEDYYLQCAAAKLKIKPEDVAMGMEQFKRASGLGVGDLRQVMEKFHDIDVSNTGTVTYPDFIKLMGMPDSEVTEETFKKLGGTISGKYKEKSTIHFKMFLKNMLTTGKGLTAEETVREAFDLINFRGTGKVTLPMFEALLKLACPDMASGQASALFKRVDKGKLGYIDIVSFGGFIRENPSFMQMFSLVRDSERDFADKKGGSGTNPVRKALAAREAGKPLEEAAFRALVDAHVAEKERQRAAARRGTDMPLGLDHAVEEEGSWDFGREHNKSMAW